MGQRFSSCLPLGREVDEAAPEPPHLVFARAASPPPPPTLSAEARRRLLAPHTPHPSSDAASICLGPQQVRHVLEVVGDAEGREQLLRALLEEGPHAFLLLPRAQEVLFAALTGEEDPQLVSALLHALRVDPLTRYVVRHPLRDRVVLPAPDDRPLDLSVVAENGEHFSRPRGSGLLSDATATVVRRAGALLDGERVHLHYLAPSRPRPLVGSSRPPTSRPAQAPPQPVAIGHSQAPLACEEGFDQEFGRRRRTVSEDTSLTDQAPSPGARNRTATYDGAADLQHRRESSNRLRQTERRMALVAPPVDLGVRGILYRTVAADYLFATPQVGFVPAGPLRCPPEQGFLPQAPSAGPPRVAMASGWYKPVGEPAVPMEMVETNPWSANF